MTKYYHLGADIYDFDTTVYVDRAQDKVLLDYLNQPNNNQLAAIIGCRQSGKTSLVRRLIDSLPKPDWLSVFVDLREYHSYEEQSLKLLPLFTKRFCEKLSEISYEQGNQAAKVQFEVISQWYNCLSDDDLLCAYPKIDEILRSTLYCLLSAHRRILIVLDEFEGISLVAKDYQQFLILIGRYVNEPAFTNIHWICTSLYQPFYDFDILQPSKFPTHPIELNEFDLSDTTITQWSEGLSHLNSEKKREITRYVLKQTGGQAYLTAKLLDKLVHRQGDNLEDVAAVIDELLLEGDPHFNTGLEIIKANHMLALRAIYAAIDLYLHGELPTDKTVKTLLLSSGLVKESRNKQCLEVKSPIYQRFFDEQWFKDAISRCSMSVINEPQIKRRDKKSILVINAGGTMGMEVNMDDGTVHEPTHELSWLKHFPRINSLAIIDYREVFAPTDGANIGYIEWRKIANTIYESKDNIDGVVVVHGTDTLAYTASAVAFALGDALPFPVVFTGSQAPYNVAHADAEVNLMRACMVASLGDELPEVVICFNDEVYRAVRAQKRNDFSFSGFHSPSYPAVARIGQSVKLNDVSIIKNPTSWRLKNHFEHRVFRISQFPGLNKNDLMLLLERSDNKGYIIESLGIGNLPTTNNEYYLNDFIREATARGIPVLISSALPIAPEFLPLYSAASGPIQAGAIPTGNMTPAAALTKFMWVLAQHSKHQLDPNTIATTIKQKILQPLIGEVTPFSVLYEQTTEEIYHE